MTGITNALLRISDSLAFGAVARHVYGVIDDPENGRKLFVRAKNNVSARSKDKTLAYRFGARDHPALPGWRVCAEDQQPWLRLSYRGFRRCNAVASSE